VRILTDRELIQASPLLAAVNVVPCALHCDLDTDRVRLHVTLWFWLKVSLAFFAISVTVCVRHMCVLIDGVVTLLLAIAAMLAVSSAATLRLFIFQVCQCVSSVIIGVRPQVVLVTNLYDQLGSYAQFLLLCFVSQVWCNSLFEDSVLFQVFFCIPHGGCSKAQV